MILDIMTKPLTGFLVFIAAALMLLTGSSGTEVTSEVTGILGANITLQFTFNNTNIRNFNHFGLYKEKHEKVAECLPNNCPSTFHINETKASLFYRFINLNLNHSQVYHAELLSEDPFFPKSNKVHLVVQEENMTRTVSPELSPPTERDNSTGSRSLTSQAVAVLLLCPLMLLASALPCVTWHLLRTREPKHPTQDVSNTTAQETAAASHEVPAVSLVYSVLDFPKRPHAVLDVNNDTQYATINYLPEENKV